MAFYSSGVEYGIHSLICMVDGKGEGREMNVREIAELQGVPYDYLGKIFTKLSRAGLVISSEGKGGGFILSRPPDQISVLDIVEAIDGEKSIFDCKEIRQRLAVFEETPPEWAWRRDLRRARGNEYCPAADGRSAGSAYRTGSGPPHVPQGTG